MTSDFAVPSAAPPAVPKAGDRVLVAMSGGVDSSVAAAMLQAQGFEVFGVTLHLWEASGDDKIGRCCSPEDQDDARRTCEILNIPHYVFDETASFRETVVDPFIETYLKGETPLPCAACNSHVKLGRFIDMADKLGAPWIATGHYARLLRDSEGHLTLARGRDHSKDQSYYLYGVASQILERLLCPLGDMTKDETRVLAEKFKLNNASKPDSQSLCFIPDGQVSRFIEQAVEESPEKYAKSAVQGRFIDRSGNTLGTHEGIHHYTVGQRKGLRLSAPKPKYVLRILDAQDVVLGDEEDLLQQRLSVHSAQWLKQMPERFRGDVRIRYRHTPSPAWVTIHAEGFDVVFDEPQRAIAPGQAAVVYVNESVICGGTIVSQSGLSN